MRLVLFLSLLSFVYSQWLFATFEKVESESQTDWYVAKINTYTGEDTTLARTSSSTKEGSTPWTSTYDTNGNRFFYVGNPANVVNIVQVSGDLQVFDPIVIPNPFSAEYLAYEVNKDNLFALGSTSSTAAAYQVLRINRDGESVMVVDLNETMPGAIFNGAYLDMGGDFLYSFYTNPSQPDTIDWSMLAAVDMSTQEVKTTKFQCDNASYVINRGGFTLDEARNRIKGVIAPSSGPGQMAYFEVNLEALVPYCNVTTFGPVGFHEVQSSVVDTYADVVYFTYSEFGSSSSGVYAYYVKNNSAVEICATKGYQHLEFSHWTGATTSPIATTASSLSGNANSDSGSNGSSSGSHEERFSINGSAFLAFLVYILLPVVLLGGLGVFIYFRYYRRPQIIYQTLDLEDEEMP